MAGDELRIRYNGDGYNKPWECTGHVIKITANEEIALADSLRKVKALSEEPGEFVYTMLRALVHRADEQRAQPFLERIGLEHPHSSKEFLIAQLLMLELEENGYLKVS